ncbi:MFS transporter [Palleronia pelagia]|uniref:Major Facilitator Superfamily protein n=1 Tax=Palleronia pelagia TaxID=387096 RepID=A0A1H8ADY4_9RHOB|nr:MFS transporter [Palleronia pelagia]SEM68048.1 Major Facilitator Superfamily protein [Palleronia pelagia]
MNPEAAARNVALYPWFKFFQSLLFWQAVWFLYFQSSLSAAAAVALYAVYDTATLILEVPSGYASDRLGRRPTLILAAGCGALGCGLLALGGGFAIFVLGQVALGAAAALASGTDSSFLYESLRAQGRGDRVEAEELRAWRFSFSALALAAVSGGALGLVSFPLTFGLGGVAFAAACLIAWLFIEPPHRGAEAANPLPGLRAAISRPVLAWLFALAVLMYGYSHIPFVFGQPFILDALRPLGLSEGTPAVSGVVTAVMMVVSVAASWAAPGLRRRFGLAALLLLAFGMQIGLSAVLAASASALVVAILFLRMVPDALSTPFILARIQPLLDDHTRATYLSVQSLAGRALFAASLFVAAGASPDTDSMRHAEMQPILAAYAVAGLMCWLGLLLWARRVPVDQPALRTK